MALHTRRASASRRLAYAALPLVAMLSATCTSCATTDTARQPIPGAEAAPATVAAAAETEVDETAKIPETLEPATGSGATATSSAPPQAAQTGTEVAPLASADTMAQGPAVSILPNESADLDPATTALAQAIVDQDVQAAAQAVAEGADLEAKDALGRSALMRAVRNQDEPMALELLRLGADPNSTDHLHDSAFLRSSAEGMVSVLRAAIEYGANLQATNHMGSTALSVASENGKVESVRVLLQHDIPVNHVNDLGWTALHEAIVLGQGSSNYLGVVRLLLLGGADPTIRDRTGSDALELASDRGLTQIVQTLRSASR